MSLKTTSDLAFGRFSGKVLKTHTGSKFALMEHPTEPEETVLFDLKDCVDYKFSSTSFTEARQYAQAIIALNAI